MIRKHIARFLVLSFTYLQLIGCSEQKLDFAKDITQNVIQIGKQAAENIDTEKVKDAAKDVLSDTKEVVEVVGDAAKEEIDKSNKSTSFSLSQIPSYSGSPYVEINGGFPFFSESDKTTEPFEVYSELDKLGRCGVAYANICKELMPTEERGEIGQIKPTGWHQNKYNEVSDNENTAGYLYNRCHLIAFMLAGENANEKNLITGTRYLNVEGMLPFESKISDYVNATENHVLYRVTPIFDGDNLLCNGVLMEAESVEDNGIRFCVFCYNVQPGITIDYKTGENWN